MTKTEKERAAELAARLRDAVMLQDPLALTVVALLKASIEQLKESLVQSSGDDTLRLQGAAQSFHKLHKELTTRPPNTKPME